MIKAKRYSKAQRAADKTRVGEHLGSARAQALCEGFVVAQRGFVSGEADPRMSVALRLLLAIAEEADVGSVPTLFSPALCPNCDTDEVDPKTMFCTEMCSQEASLVRYVRRKLTANGLAAADVLRDGIGSYLLMLRSGGYPTRQRTVPAALRALIIERDAGRCRRCGDAGTDIDHIAGSAASLENLQLLCSDCNGTKMTERVIQVSAEDEPDLVLRIREQDARLALRIGSVEPLRVCDDEEGWPKQWRCVQKRCRAAREPAVPSS